jgi:phage gpG-like protein
MRMRVDVKLMDQLPLEGLEQDIIREAAEELKEEARNNVKKQSGELQRSIEILEINNRAAKVGTRLIYGPIHEFGGTIRPKKGKVMRYKIDGKWVTLRGVTIKESRYLRNAAREINKKLPQIARRVMKEKGI